MISKNFGLLILLLYSSSAFATPAQILIIRHAEKPLGEEGRELSEKGFKRARLLVDYFKNNPKVTKFGTPVALYAMQPKDETGSIRAIQTLTPLANTLALPILSPYKKKELAPLVSKILSNKAYEGKTVLICWEHKIIPEMAETFGVHPRPGEWRSTDFSTVYEINFSNNKVSNFKTFPEDVSI